MTVKLGAFLNLSYSFDIKEWLTHKLMSFRTGFGLTLTQRQKKKKWWFTCTFLALRYWFSTKYVLRHNMHTFRKVNVNGSSHLIVLASLLCPPSLQQKTWEVTMPCSQMVRRDIKQFPANSHLYWGENERKARETDWQLKGSSENEL